MRFNEWLTTKNYDGGNDDDVLENQMEQWMDRLSGLLHNVPSEKKKAMLEKIMNGLQQLKEG